MKVLDIKVFGIIFVPNRDKVEENVEIRNNIIVLKLRVIITTAHVIGKDSRTYLQ